MEQAALKTRLSLLAGVIAGPLFILVYLIEGAFREGYDPLRHPVSSLALGSRGWIQIASFIVTGSLYLALSYGLKKFLKTTPGGTWGPILIGAAGIGLIGAGVFSTDPLFGYPADGPFLLTQQTTHGHLHNLFSFLVFIDIPVTCSVFRRRFKMLGEKRWANYSLISGIMMPLFFILAAVGFNQVEGFAAIAGVLQRLSTIFGFIWITFLSLHFLSQLKEKKQE